jgi:hypothetical protein
MRRVLLRLALPLIALLLLAAAVEGQSATLYVNRLLVAEPGDIRLADLVNTSGPIPGSAQETLARSIAVASDKVLYLPAALYVELLERAFGSGSIIVGSRTVVVPRGALPEGEAFIMDRLADFLDGQGLLGDGKIELAITHNQVRGTLPHEGNPVFQIQKTAKGTIEVRFTLAGTGGSSVTGRVALSAAGAGSVSGGGVKSGGPVRVFFRKGPITIEMAGTSLAAAAVGERVRVRVADGQRNFTGRVMEGNAMEGKVVEVDLP